MKRPKKNKPGPKPQGGRKTLTRSLSMLPEQWERLKTLADGVPLGRYVAKVLELTKI